MTANEFVTKWKGISQKERSVAQSHFNDLCALLGEPNPLDADPTGSWYAFEKGATKTTGGDGWADVWKQGCFAWEYKGKYKDLNRAFVQLQQYAVALQNPPLLIVSDIERIRIVTNWTNTVSATYEITLDDLLVSEKRRLLKNALNGSETLKPTERRDQLTAKVANKFADLAKELGAAGHDPQTVAHFINRLVFCMFAEDIGILPDRLFTKLLEAALKQHDTFQHHATELFKAMCTGGSFGLDQIAWFNGGLFDDSTALPLHVGQVRTVYEVAQNDWSAIDPSIFGTLFERGLDPAKRSQLGAHYTDPENIMRIIEPVVLRPLRQEWEEARARIEKTKRQDKKKAELAAYLERLRAVRVLDPACGSGNFLYLALKSLKDHELFVLLDAEALGLGKAFPELDVSCVKGIELSPFAAELARVTVWIGELQWQEEHGFGVRRNPILRALETIENRDALLATSSPSEGIAAKVVEATWPGADFIIGNPPFLGGKLLRRELGDATVECMFSVFEGKVPREADLCVYWFEKARAQIVDGSAKCAGLIATQGIRGGANRRVLQRIKDSGDIFFAWSDLDWVLDGAAVHVSILGFDGGTHTERSLDGQPVLSINSSLASSIDLSVARRLPANSGRMFMGTTNGGPFDISVEEAISMLALPNAHGVPNSDVIRPWSNAKQLTQRATERWVIDFGVDRDESSACKFEAPFYYVELNVRPVRDASRTTIEGQWWLQERRRAEMRAATQLLGRQIVTLSTGKHRIFAFLPTSTLPDHALFVVAAEDGYTFGVLHSRFHEAWALAQGTQLREKESGFRYTPTTCFETFPFPEPTVSQRQTIGDAARELNELRENWLNPPEWTTEETLVFPATVGGPWHRWIPNADNLAPGAVTDAEYVRRVAKPGAKAMVAARTLTRLYNDRPAWLRHAHEKLDVAVAAAYGVEPNTSEPELLAFLLALNLERAAG